MASARAGEHCDRSLDIPGIAPPQIDAERLMEIEQDTSPMLFCKGGFDAVAFQAAIDAETP